MHLLHKQSRNSRWYCTQPATPQNYVGTRRLRSWGRPCRTDAHCNTPRSCPSPAFAAQTQHCFRAIIVGHHNMRAALMKASSVPLSDPDDDAYLPSSGACSALLAVLRWGPRHLFLASSKGKRGVWGRKCNSAYKNRQRHLATPLCAPPAPLATVLLYAFTSNVYVQSLPAAHSVAICGTCGPCSHWEASSVPL